MTTTQHSISLKGREVQFQSACETLAEAYHVVAAAVLAGKVKGSEFVESLLLAARQRRLSLRQVGWIHFLATETLNPAAVAHARAVPDLNLLPIVEMMAKAAAAQAGDRSTVELCRRCYDNLLLPIERLRARAAVQKILGDCEAQGDRT